MAKTISCDIHDYFEIACMRKSFIHIDLHTKQCLEGVALDVFARKGKEYLKIETKNSIQEVELTNIKSLKAREDSEPIRVS